MQFRNKNLKPFDIWKILVKENPYPDTKTRPEFWDSETGYDWLLEEKDGDEGESQS